MAKEFGRELYCHRNTTNRPVDLSTSVFHAIHRFGLAKKRVLLHWLALQGPFWEEMRQHDPGQWLECSGDIVTDTAIGEAAYCATVGVDRRLVSLAPSEWEQSPIAVTMLPNGPTDIAVVNYWDPPKLLTALQNSLPLPTSWNEVERQCRSRFQKVAFSADSFSPLNGQPFSPGPAKRIISLLYTLDQLMGCVDARGHRTIEGHQIYQDHFTGDKAWFSDSSDTEKRKFEKEFTFPHPTRPGHSLFCTWHGKVKTPQLRLHFDWPERPGSPLYVVYVGRKIAI